MKYQEVPTEKYPALSFETVLHVDECLVIGCIADDRETLGAVLFGAEAMGHPRSTCWPSAPASSTSVPRPVCPRSSRPDAVQRQ